MSEPVRLVVPDASVLVKLFREEAGSDQAAVLIAENGRGAVRLVLASLTVQEALGVARRELGVQAARELWSAIRDMEVTIVEFDDTVAEAAFSACERYGCAFYDAVAPALAELTGGELWSGDRRAHSRVPGVVLVG